MAPLTDRSVNRQSRIPVVGAESRSRVNNENMPPASNLSRLLAPTKSSVARSRSPSPTPIPLPIAPTPKSDSATPGRGRLSTVTSNDRLNTSFARRQSLHRPSPTPVLDALTSPHDKALRKSTSKPILQSMPGSPAYDIPDMPSSRFNTQSSSENRSFSAEKPLPSQPFTYVTSSTNATTRTTAIAELLTETPSTQRPAVSPSRPVSRSGDADPRRTPSKKRNSSSRLPRTSVPSSPAVVSPLLAHMSANFDASYNTSPVSAYTHPVFSVTRPSADEDRPPRSSSLRTPNPASSDVGLGIGMSPVGGSSNETQARKYLPAAHSFSRPRAQQTDRSPASIKAITVPKSPSLADSNTSGDRLGSPRRRSNSVRNSPASISGPLLTDDILTFAGRRLDGPTDLAALDQGSARSTRRRADTIKTSPPNKTNLTVVDLPPRVPSPAQQGRMSPIRLIFGDKAAESDDVFEYSRVKQISGSLLSSSFAGSTLSISDEADQLLLGSASDRAPSYCSQSNLAAPADTEFDLPSPSENGFRVSWPADFGFSSGDSGQQSPTVQSSPSVRPQAFSRISEESETSVDKQTQEPTDHQDESQVNSGHQAKDNKAIHEDRVRDINTTLSVLEGTPIKEQVEADAVPKPVRAHLSMGRLPKATVKDNVENLSQPRLDRLPSYMLPTPASEARKNSVVSPSDGKRNNAGPGSASISSGRRASQAAKLGPTPNSDKGRVSPSGRQTPVSETRRAPQSGRSTPVSEIPRLQSKPSSSTLRSSTLTTRPAVTRQASHQALVSATKFEDGTAHEKRRPSLGNIRPSNQAQVPSEISRDGSFTPVTRPRSESKGKSVLNNLKGLFSGKRDAPSTPGTSSRRFSIGSRKSVSLETEVPDVPDVPALPHIPQTRRKSTTKSILVKKAAPEEIKSPISETPKSTLPKSRRKSTAREDPQSTGVSADKEQFSLRRKMSKSKMAAREPTPEVDTEKETRDTVTLMEMGLTLRQEAFKEDDLARKERMTSFAQVMLDTVTNAVEAERNMYAAMQAAEQAKMSYMMTQQSVQEMNKLVSTSRRLPLFKKKKRPTDGA